MARAKARDRQLVAPGDTFGRWTITGDCYLRDHAAWFPCECECGTKRDVRFSQLGARSLSCGCLQKEAASQSQTTHGLSKHPEYRRYSQLKQRYGIAREDWFLMFDDQGGRCPVCDEPLEESSACVDHDHATGRVRGLLCRSCNMAIGLLKDDPDSMMRGASYLERAADGILLGG